jgi:hypothetical protein
MLPSDVAAKLNECANTDFVGMRDWWFSLVSCATALVAFGLVLEAPELIHDLIPIGRKIVARLKKLPVGFAKHETPEWVKVVAFVGWIFIVVGVVGEEFAGIKVKNLDANIQECSDAKVREATIEAGDAKSSADKAADAAKRADADAGGAENEANAVSKLVKQIHEHLTPRSLTPKEKEDLSDAFKPFADPNVRIVVIGSWDSGLNIQIWRSLIDAGFAKAETLQIGGPLPYGMQMSAPLKYLTLADKISTILLKARIGPMMGLLGRAPDNEPIRIFIGDTRTAPLPSLKNPGH